MEYNNQASELYELCKKVYERTKLPIAPGMFHFNKDGHVLMRSYGHGVAYLPENGDVPLYTSDYLLGKLPRSIKRYGRFELVPTMRNTRWSAGYWTGDRLDTLSVVDYTPLKALLKLTIALSEAGELK